MKILDRYIMVGVLATSASALFLCFFLFAVGILTALLNQGVSVITIISVLPTTLLVTLPYIIPIALFLGCSLTLGRLQVDGEVIAFRAHGVPAIRLIWPALAVAAIFSGALLWLSRGWIPHAHSVKNDIVKAELDALMNAWPSSAKSYIVFDWLKISYSRHDGSQIHDLVIQSRRGKPDFTHFCVRADLGRIQAKGDTLYILCQDAVIYQIGRETDSAWLPLRETPRPEAWLDYDLWRTEAPSMQFPIALSRKGLKPAELDSRHLTVAIREVRYRRRLSEKLLKGEKIAACSHPMNSECEHFPEQDRKLLAEIHAISADRGDKKFFDIIFGDKKFIEDLEEQEDRFTYQAYLRLVLPLSCLAFALVGAAVPLVLPQAHRILACVVGLLLIGVSFYPWVLMTKVFPAEATWIGLISTGGLGAFLAWRGGFR